MTNIIILIPLADPKKTKAYRSLKKLCEEHGFPKFALYDRKKYPYPFEKEKDGQKYFFIKQQLNL